MLNNDKKRKDLLKGEEEMAVLHNTVNEVQRLCEIKGFITDFRVKLFEAINKLTEEEKKIEYITFNLEELSDEEIMVLNMFHMMEDEQNNFAEEIIHINYEGLGLDD